MEKEKNWVLSIAFLVVALVLSFLIPGKTFESTLNWNVKDLFFYPFIPLLFTNVWLSGFFIKKRVETVVVISVLSLTQTVALGRSFSTWSMGLSLLGNLFLVLNIAERTWSLRRIVWLVLIPPLMTCFSQIIWRPKSYRDRVKEKILERQTREKDNFYLSKPEDKKGE